MTCYDVDITPIERAFDAINKLSIDLAEAEPEDFARHARENAGLFRELVSLYLDSVSCFFSVMRAVAARMLILERDTPSEPRVDRYYLQRFLPLYDKAVTRSLSLLQQLLEDAFFNAPELQAEFISQMMESGTIQEKYEYATSVRTAGSSAEAKSHGQVGHQIEDSVKEFIKSFINDARIAKWTLKKKNIERGFQILNEVLHMVF